MDDETRFRSAGVSPAQVSEGRWYSRGYLPHFDQPGLVQMITFRLADSLPRSVLDSVQDAATIPARRARTEALLDAGHGACLLSEPRIAQLVEAALRHFDACRYDLYAWVIMPNHVHALIETVPGYPLSSVIQSWKSYTAKAANQFLGRTGVFWQPDYFDRAIRNERHLTSAIGYIHRNPVKAGLAEQPGDWPFSSASHISRE